MPFLLCALCDPPAEVDATPAAYDAHHRQQHKQSNFKFSDTLPIVLETNPGVAIRRATGCQSCHLLTRCNRLKGNHGHGEENIRETFVVAGDWDNSRTMKELFAEDSAALEAIALSYAYNTRPPYRVVSGRFGPGKDLGSDALNEMYFHADEEIIDASQTRKYCEFGNGNQADKVSILGMLFPTKYTLRENDKPWPCPLRGCNKEFVSNVEVGRHFKINHAFCAFRDNMDGSLSIAGKLPTPRSIVVSTASRGSQNGQPVGRAREQPMLPQQSLTVTIKRRLEDPLQMPAPQKRIRVLPALDPRKKSAEIGFVHENLFRPQLPDEPEPGQLHTPFPFEKVLAHVPGMMTRWQPSDLVQLADPSCDLTANIAALCLCFYRRPKDTSAHCIDPKLWDYWKQQREITSWPDKPADIRRPKFYVIPAEEDGQWYCIMIAYALDKIFVVFLDALCRDHSNDILLLSRYFNIKGCVGDMKPFHTYYAVGIRPAPADIQNDSGVYMLAYIYKFLASPHKAIASIVKSESLGWCVNSVEFRHNLFLSVQASIDDSLYLCFSRFCKGGLQALEEMWPGISDRLPAWQNIESLGQGAGVETAFGLEPLAAPASAPASALAPEIGPGDGTRVDESAPDTAMPDIIELSCGPGQSAGGADPTIEVARPYTVDSDSRGPSPSLRLPPSPGEQTAQSNPPIVLGEPRPSLDNEHDVINCDMSEQQEQQQQQQSPARAPTADMGNDNINSRSPSPANIVSDVRRRRFVKREYSG